MNLFKIAGVDMTSTRPIEGAFEVLGNYIDRLDELTSKYMTHVAALNSMIFPHPN